MDNLNLEALKRLLILIDETTNQKELLTAFQSALIIISKIENATGKEFESIKKDCASLLNAYETLSKKIDGDTRLEELRAELLAQIDSIELQKGDKGDAYILTEEDKKQIAQTINVPVVERVIERIETIKETPIINETVREVALHETPEKIRDKLETLKGDERLDKSAIKGLEELLSEMKFGSNAPQVFSGARTRFIDDETPTGTIDGANTIFVISKSPVAGSVKVFRGGARQRITEDYTLSNRTITFTIAPVTGEIILADYRY